MTTTSTTDSNGEVSSESHYLTNDFNEISVEEFRNNIYPNNIFIINR